MGRHRLFWRLYATYLLVIALCAVAIGVYAASSAHDLYLQESEDDLLVRAHLVADEIDTMPGGLDDAGLQARITRLGWAGVPATADRDDPEVLRDHTRITVVAPDGSVLADSDVADPGALENHASRPEVKQALEGDDGVSIRFSETLDENLLYVATPLLGADGGVEAVVRTAVPLVKIDDALDDLYRNIALIAALVALAAALVGLIVSRRISGRMRQLETGAERFAAGDFGRRLEVSSIEEFGGVARSLNQMAERLDETIHTITDQRNERDAVLSSMVEGVLAVDTDERIISVNRAAEALLGIDDPDVQGTALHEAVRVPGLQSFVAATLVSQEPVEDDIVLHSNEPEATTRYLQASGSPLRATDGGALGAVIVLNDVTRLRRLETVRRDFIANVSHELRTPVTSIKGFAETLLDGALDDRDDAEHFLRIIVDQAERLNAIVADLLSISRIERDPEGEEVPLEETRLIEVIRSALEVCEPRAAQADVGFECQCDDDLVVRAAPALLEQAVVNLVDNAIKYSPAGAVVSVSATVRDDEVALEVADHGSGIDRRHLPRLFERFYRVDKARSRDLGGTGLGLAIVNHISQVHGGRVTVESTPGVGSRFTIFLPR
jgi:two-component system phosphate regulon sensor histidine kinase PhoR